MKNLRILVVSRSYPAQGNLYQYPFVHRRILSYRHAGHEVGVFRPSVSGDAGSHEFEGVECHSGNVDQLDRLACRLRPDVLAVHGLGPRMWPTIETLARSVPLAAWLHGSEIPGFLRRKSALDGIDPETIERLTGSCSAFWSNFLKDTSVARRLVFPSREAVGYAEEGMALQAEDYAVIPNPIDTDLFKSEPKTAEQRSKVLFIRPFDSAAYGNDIAFEAITLLSKRPGFESFQFKIFGDGPLFLDVVSRLPRRSNISIERHFLSQAEIANEHQKYGVFLVPTRLDTQGVSRDEAMSSGLVPITNRVGPISEFVDEQCGFLTPPNDPDAMASAMTELAADRTLFSAKSKAAADRIRADRSSARIIPLEIALLRELANG